MIPLLLPSSSLATLRLAALFLCFFSILASPLSAQGFARHEGGQDPETEGWTLVRGESDGVSAKAVEEKGRSAWQIVNTANGSGGSHTFSYSTPVKPEATMEGWELTVSLQVATPGVVPGAQIAAGFVANQDAQGNPLDENQHRSYRIYFGSTGDGRTRVRLAGTEGNTYVCPDNGNYHFKLRWKRGDGAVSFHVNDTLVVADYAGEPLTSRTKPYVMWGNTASTAADRVANWKKVTFSQGLDEAAKAE